MLKMKVAMKAASLDIIKTKQSKIRLEEVVPNQEAEQLASTTQEIKKTKGAVAEVVTPETQAGL